jgi:drug/metabolite transporter (DMT)-like permease
VQRGLKLNALSLQLGAIASVLNAFALGRLGAVEAALIGTATALLVSLLAAARRGERLRLGLGRDRDRGWALLGAGLLDGLGNLGLFAGLALIGPVPVALLGALSPVFAALLAWGVLGERPRRAQLLAGGLAVVGALLFSWREGASPTAPGLLLAAGATLAYAGSNLLSTLALRARSPAEVLAGTKLWALCACAAAGLLGGRLHVAPLDAAGVGLTVLAALLGNYLAVRLFLEALRRDGLAVSAAVRAAGPMATAAAAWPFFPVVLSPVNLAGGAVLLAAVAWLGGGRRSTR